MKKLLTMLALCAGAIFAADGAGVYGSKCAMCHGANGKDTSLSPKPIAGMADTEAKIKGYKAGTVGGENKATMQTAVADMNDADIKAVSAFVSTLK